MGRISYWGNRFLLYGMISVLSGILSSCTLENRDDPLRPQTLRIGILPDQEFGTPGDYFQSFNKYLSNETGISIEMIFPESYDLLLEQFGKGKVDLAYFGGVTFIMAHRRFGAEPLIMREGDRAFQSYYLVRAGHPAKSIQNLQGQSFSFGAHLSTSGHLMPRYFMSVSNK